LTSTLTLDPDQELDADPDCDPFYYWYTPLFGIFRCFLWSGILTIKSELPLRVIGEIRAVNFVAARYGSAIRSATCARNLVHAAWQPFGYGQPHSSHPWRGGPVCNIGHYQSDI